MNKVTIVIVSLFTFIVFHLSAPTALAQASTELITHSIFGGSANADSDTSQIADNGSAIVFHSAATDLVTGDTNGGEDIFVRQISTGVTTRVSIDSSGVQGQGRSRWPAISANGRYVTFSSSAENLILNDSNNRDDVFWHDRETGLTRMVSVRLGGDHGDGQGLGGNNDSWSSSVSADGRYVAFYSDASNLIQKDRGNQLDVFVRDMQSNALWRVSNNHLGKSSDSYSGNPKISADGKFIAYESNASDLVMHDTNGARDIFVYSMVTGGNRRVSVDSMGAQSDASSNRPSISANGLTISFYSDASNLVSGDTNGFGDIFVWDNSNPMTLPMVSLVSGGFLGQPSNGTATNTAISGNGRYVVFDSSASNLVSGDTNNAHDVFRHDRFAGTSGFTQRVNISSNGNQSQDGFISGIPSVTFYGERVSFFSAAPNLVPNDNNSERDIFLHDLN